MIKQTLVALALLCIAINTTAQILYNETARYYLPTSTTFSQSQIDSYNVTNLYMFDIINGQAKTYPDLQPIQLTWNGTAWETPTPTAITTDFTTLLKTTNVSHVAPQVPGALAQTVTINWNAVSGVTQYRCRIKPVGGNWNVTTVTGTTRNLTNLLFNTTYEVQVRVYINSTTQGEYTQSYFFTTPSYVPLPSCEQPTATGSIIGNQLVIDWTSVPYATSYLIQCRQLGSLTWGGASRTGNTHSFTIDTTKAYEFRVRANCTGTSSPSSNFTPIDTATKAICAPPTNLYNIGNTFYWTDYQYSALTQIQTRLLGTESWGGTTTTNGQYQFKYLWGTHEWRVRSRCYATTSLSWTGWSYGVTGFIPQPIILSAEQFDTKIAYPNPANEQVNLQGEIVIRDLTGRVIATGNDVLDVSHIAEGLYFVNGQKLIVKH